MGEEQLGTTFENVDVVIIPDGVPRKPGLTVMFSSNINAGMVESLCSAFFKILPRGELSQLIILFKLEENQYLKHI